MSQILIEESFKIEKYKTNLIKENELLKQSKNLDELNLAFQNIIDKNIDNYINKTVDKKMKDNKFNLIYNFLQSKLNDTNRKESMFNIINTFLKGDLNILLNSIENNNLKQQLKIEIESFRVIYSKGERNLKNENNFQDAKKIKDMLLYFDYLNIKDNQLNKFQQLKSIKVLFSQNVKDIEKFSKEFTNIVDDKNQISLKNDFPLTTFENTPPIKNNLLKNKEVQVMFKMAKKKTFFTSALTYFMFDQNQKLSDVKILKNKSNNLISHHYINLINNEYEKLYKDNKTINQKVSEDSNFLIEQGSNKFLSELKRTFTWFDKINISTNTDLNELNKLKLLFKELKNTIFKNILNNNVSKKDLLVFNDKNVFIDLYNKYKESYGINKAIEASFKKNNLSTALEVRYVYKPKDFKDKIKNQIEKYDNFIKENLNSTDTRLLYLQKLQKDINSLIFHYIKKELNEEDLNSLSTTKKNVLYKKAYKKAIFSIEDSLEKSFDFNEELTKLLSIENIKEYYDSPLGKVLLMKDLEKNINFYLRKSIENISCYPYINNSKRIQSAKDVLSQINLQYKYLDKDQALQIENNLKELNKFFEKFSKNKSTGNSKFELKKIHNDLTLKIKYFSSKIIKKDVEFSKEEFEQEINNILSF